MTINGALNNCLYYSTYGSLKQDPLKFATDSDGKNYYSLTEVTPLPMNTYHQAGSGPCTAQTVAAGSKVYLFGNVVPPDTFVLGTIMN